MMMSERILPDKLYINGNNQIMKET